jgi:hypothetical protein
MEIKALHRTLYRPKGQETNLHSQPLRYVMANNTKIFQYPLKPRVTQEWRKLRNKELRNLYSSTNIMIVDLNRKDNGL